MQLSNIYFLNFFRAAKQHQKQQEKTAKHFNDLLPPSFLSAEERHLQSTQLPPHRGQLRGNELFGTQYHPSKYSRDPQTMSTTIQLSSALMDRIDRPSGTSHDRSSGPMQPTQPPLHFDLSQKAEPPLPPLPGSFAAHAAGTTSDTMTWDLQLTPFSREAHSQSPPYGVANC